MPPFTYEYRYQNTKALLSVEVPIPLAESVADFFQKVVNAHAIPCFVTEGLKVELQSFVKAEEDKYYASCCEHQIQQLKLSENDFKAICSKWAKVYKKETRRYAKSPRFVDTEFATLYKKLIHSSSLTSILNVEHAYAMAIQDLIRDKERTLTELERRQDEEMNDALAGGIGGRAFSDSQINNLAQRHFERREFESSHWEEELKKLKDEQRTQYHDWLKQIDADPQTSAVKARSLSQSMSNSMTDDGSGGVNPPHTRLEESFTIHLGAQLKTTHNLRLLSADVLDLCRHTADFVSGKVAPEPLRLQTALSLYSKKLCALILLVDDRLSSYSGVKQEFAKVCSQSTDFHFPELQKQFEEIEKYVSLHNESKLIMQQQALADSSSVKSGSSESSIDSQEKKTRLKPGSFYLTKHSNLAEVHLVFHLVVDDSLFGDITSRHAVILGLRNILKACFKHDIFTLTVPLLLSMEMTEEMTIPWCMRRSELVFKCVKGFMMEMSTWADSESRNIQFLVPPNLSVDAFNMLSNMLPGIFRQSSPIVGSS